MRSLLNWLTDLTLGRAIAGDLEEQRRRRARTSPVAATCWFAWKWLAIVVFIGAARLPRACVETAQQLCRPGNLVRDATYAIRSLRRSPGYTATTVGVIALSMALATTVFAVVDGVLFRPLPYSDAGQLASIEAGWTTEPENVGNFTVSRSELTTWQAAAPEVRFAGFSPAASRLFIDEGAPVNYGEVTEDFFEVLGQRPLIGGFRSQDFVRSGGATPGLISYQTWQQRFGGDPSIVGRVLSGFRGEHIEVVGILPEDFLFPANDGRFVPDVIRPLVRAPGDAMNRGRELFVLARVPHGYSLARLQSGLETATLALARDFPPVADKPWTRPFDLTRVRPIATMLGARTRSTFRLAFSVAAVLVLLACLNVTGLAVARSQDRRREFALRRALGSGGTDLMRLLLAESALIVGAGGALGLAFAMPLTRATAAVLPAELALLHPLAVDARVVAFAFIAFTACTVMTTLWPVRVAIGPSRPVLADTAGTTRRQRTAGRFVLIAAQVSIALVMALGAALVGGSLVRLWREDPGFRIQNVYAFTLSGRTDGGDRATVERLFGDLRRLPGVLSAAGSNQWLLQKAIIGSNFERPQGAMKTGNVDRVGVTQGFLDVTAVRLTAGRFFTDDELTTGAHVALVSDKVARAYWPDGDAVGKVLARAGDGYQVVGVVGEARYVAFDREPDGNIYYPLFADPKPGVVTLYLQVDPERANVTGAALALVADGYPMYRVTAARTLAAALGSSVRSRQFQAALFVAFGVAAVATAGVGVLALVAIVTTRRTREVGVRMALGARRSEIAGLIVRQELVAVWSGLAAGAIMSSWLVQLVGAYLYKTSAYDPVMWATAAVLLLVVATVGALVPALRASRVDPVQALRMD
jgi:predicted permease